MSGWRHFVDQGWLENRVGVSSSIREDVQRRKNYEVDHILPPAFLRKRVHGAEDPESFEQAGRALALNVFERLRHIEGAGGSFRVLDHGAGCGRVMRPLQELCRQSPPRDRIEWHGCDIDGQAIEWSRTYLGSRASFVVNAIYAAVALQRRLFRFRLFDFDLHPSPRGDAVRLAWRDQSDSEGRGHRLHLHPFLRTGSQPERGKTDRSGFSPLGRKRRRGPAGFLPDFVPHPRVYRARGWPTLLLLPIIATKGVNNDQNLVMCRRLT